MFARSRLSDVDSGLGVLPVETILADEHDLVHRDDVRSRLAAISPHFDATQVLDPGGLAHALLDAWQLLSIERNSLLDGIATPPVDPPPADTPLDLVSMFVIGEPPEPISAVLRQALAGAYNARQDSTSAPDAQARIAAADEVLAAAIVDRLNALLNRRLADEACFRPFVEAGCIAALGDETLQSDELANRLLLEAAFPTQLEKMRDRRLALLYASVREHETAALCLSGGGIRSATFALGVLRGLARHQLLGKFDFLSTVSGGGYIGSWLSAWMHHAGAAEVQRELGRAGHEKLQPDPEPIRHLRAYSHYLSPRVGFLSGDTWTLAATLMRNLFLNWLVLVPLMAAVVLVPRFLLSLITVGYGDLDWMGPLAKNILLSEALVLGAILGTAAVSFVHRHRSGEEPAARASGEIRPSQRAFLIHCLAPLVASAMMLAGVWYLWWHWSEQAPGVRLFDLINGGDATSAAVAAAPADRVVSVFAAIESHWMASLTFILLALVMHTAGWIAAGRARARDLGEAVALIATGAAAGAVTLVVAMWFVVRPYDDANQRLYVTLAPPAYLTVILLGSQVFTGWTSRVRNSTDSEREWVARFNAWLLIVIVCWSAGSAIVLFGPNAVHAAWQRVSLAILGSGTGLITVLFGRSTRTAGPSGTAPSADVSAIGGTARRIALALAAPVFALSIVIALAALNETVIGNACDFPALAGAMQCVPIASDPTIPAQSVPLEMLSTTANARILTLASQVRRTGADAHLHERLQSLARDASAAAGERGPAFNAALHAVVAAHGPDIGSAVARSIATDSAFVDRSAGYTRAVLSADSITMAGGQTDSVLRANFYDRVKLDRQATGNMAARLRARDTLAAEGATVLRSIDSVASARHADTAVTQALVRLRDTLTSRITSAAETERQLRADSVSRALSRATVDSLLRVGAVANPSPTTMPIIVLVLFALLLGIAVLMGWRIDTNKFSLHGMYYARLVRAYLGASRAACDRNPNPFTGFDASDDLPLRELWPACAGEDEHGAASGRSDDAPPLHVVNMTLNLVGGANLAWQQRKAESFTATSLHAGSAFVGYRRTSDAGCRVAPAAGCLRFYGGASGMTLGTAMTISGAAASPNAGENSSPLLTFLMTLFNARLGSWLGNPGRAGTKSFDQSAPTQKIRPIVEEMFGLTSDQSPWVYLSDGGHFENLGLYEMVLRRCRFIVVSDAGCDLKCTFDDLGNAVRKIRVDLGVPIEFPSAVQIFARNQAPTGAATSYWAIGRIRYSVVDRTDDDAGTDDDYDGVLLYLKPAIYGNEPRDVYNYAQVSADFPHESTTDQFFSESQFESYRALGEFVIDELVARSTADGAGAADVPIRGQRPGSLLSHWPRLRTAPPVKAGEGAPSVFISPLGAPVEPLH